MAPGSAEYPVALLHFHLCGRVVKREDTCFARRRSGFDSPRVHHFFGALAHLGERKNGILDVTGSSPVGSTIFIRAWGSLVSRRFREAEITGSNPVARTISARVPVLATGPALLTLWIKGFESLASRHLRACIPSG